MTDNSVSEVRMTQKEPERERRIFTFKATQLVWLLFGILEAALALRVGLKLIAANPDSPIAAFVYGFTSLFLLPFAGLTGTPSAGAMVVYALIAWGLERIIWLIFYRPTAPVEGVTRTTTTDHHTQM